MELSGRLFGFSSWSLLAPQALEGVAAVGLLYATVRRWFSPAAALLSAALLALTPVAGADVPVRQSRCAPDAAARRGRLGDHGGDRTGRRAWLRARRPGRRERLGLHLGGRDRIVDDRRAARARDREGGHGDRGLQRRRPGDHARPGSSGSSRPGRSTTTSQAAAASAARAAAVAAPARSSRGWRARSPRRASAGRPSTTSPPGDRYRVRGCGSCSRAISSSPSRSPRL